MKALNGLTGCVILSAAALVGCGSTDEVTNFVQANAPSITAFSASGANVVGVVTNFRAALGDPNNAAGPAAASGRREVNWDAVPGGQTNTNAFPGNFFNTNSPRGLLMATPGTGLRVSDNNFSDVDASYAAQFNNFSPIRTFSSAGGNVIEVIFNVPGTQQPGGVTGFGAVFSDVDTAGSSTLEFFDSVGTSLAVLPAPQRSDAGGLSFVAALAPQNRAFARVRITLGTGNLAPGNLDISAGGTQDLVIVDDFLYGEPQPVPGRVIAGSGNITGVVRAFQAALGEPNNGAGAAAAAGRREVNWDAVPGGQTNTNTFPANFFNVNSPRGLVMATPGTGLRVSDNNFADVDASYAAQFAFFSPVRTFSPVGGNSLDCNFFRAGTATAARVNGFGAVFSDVDVANATRLQFVSGADSLGTFLVPTRSDPGGLSFMGVQFAPTSTASLVRLTLGTGNLGPGLTDISVGGANDLVIVDDFLYSEPQ
ncbi:hypothetical protein IV102_03790 [bacterium]|nr:hypothetical protein [bacterium]